MPELPEVERGRKLAQRVARGRRITRVILVGWTAEDNLVEGSWYN